MKAGLTLGLFGGSHKYTNDKVSSNLFWKIIHIFVSSLTSSNKCCMKLSLDYFFLLEHDFKNEHYIFQFWLDKYYNTNLSVMDLLLSRRKQRSMRAIAIVWHLSSVCELSYFWHLLWNHWGNFTYSWLGGSMIGSYYNYVRQAHPPLKMATVIRNRNFFLK